MQISLKLNKSVQENAAVYFEKSKKDKKKLEGAKKAIEITRKKLAKAETEMPEEEKIDAKQFRKKEWFEKFRWFISSEGFLVVGGRDSTTNELVIKKYTDKDDVVFHTDMAGSPFFVVKTNGAKVGEKTLQEVCNATFTFSRAAKTQMTADTFYVNPEQVSKTAEAGESLTKGAFMIRGKTNYLKPSFDLAVGINDKQQIIAGPLDAIKQNCSKSVILEKGEKEKSSDIAKKIMKQLGGELDEILRALPAANVRIKK